MDDSRRWGRYLLPKMHIIQYRRKLKWSAVRHLCQTLLGRYPSNDLRRAAKVAIVTMQHPPEEGEQENRSSCSPFLPSFSPLSSPSFLRPRCSSNNLQLQQKLDPK